ncbi:MAG: TetR/AcrR family transcriptional regulator [Eubacterium sp.]|nr:TetR/AcrR family transcriptional regulator [Candidatus Colimonas fimequi]
MGADRRIIKTKKAIKQAFTRLLLEHRSMSNISVTKLVEAADISRGTFYLHYADMYELLADVEADLIIEFETAVNTHEATELKDSLLPLIREIISFIEANSDILSILVTDRLDLNFTLRLKEITRQKCFENWERNFGTKPNKAHEYYYSFIFAGSVDLIIEWFQGEIDETADSMAQIIERIIVEGANVLD